MLLPQKPVVCPSPLLPVTGKVYQPPRWLQSGLWAEQSREGISHGEGKKRRGVITGGPLPPAWELERASLGPAAGLGTEETPWSRGSNKMKLHNANHPGSSPSALRCTDLSPNRVSGRAWDQSQLLPPTHKWALSPPQAWAVGLTL